MSSPSGIIPISYAFFDKDGKLCRESMRRQTQAMVAAHAPAVAILGLATEVNKLSVDERKNVMDWTAEDIGGKVPMIVTVNGQTIAEQAELAAYAQKAGAAHLIFQPPSKAMAEDAVAAGEAVSTEAYCEEFFCRVLEKTTLPSGIQNAPEYMGVGLSPAAITRLAKRASTFRFLKGEGPCILIEQVIAALGGDFPVLNGRGGQELTDNLRAGCRGMIVAPDVSDWQQKVYAAMKAGNEQEAEELYRKILPVIVFVMQSLDSLLVYGKRIAAWRLGFEVQHDRAPALQTTEFGLKTARRFADYLGPYGS